MRITSECLNAIYSPQVHAARSRRAMGRTFYATLLVDSRREESALNAAVRSDAGDSEDEQALEPWQQVGLTLSTEKDTSVQLFTLKEAKGKAGGSGAGGGSGPTAGAAAAAAETGEKGSVADAAKVNSDFAAAAKMEYSLDPESLEVAEADDDQWAAAECSTDAIIVLEYCTIWLNPELARLPELDLGEGKALNRCVGRGYKRKRKRYF